MAIRNVVKPIKYHGRIYESKSNACVFYETELKDIYHTVVNLNDANNKVKDVMEQIKKNIQRIQQDIIDIEVADKEMFRVGDATVEPFLVECASEVSDHYLDISKKYATKLEELVTVYNKKQENANKESSNNINYKVDRHLNILSSKPISPKEQKYYYRDIKEQDITIDNPIDFYTESTNTSKILYERGGLVSSLWDKAKGMGKNGFFTGRSDLYLDEEKVNQLLINLDGLKKSINEFAGEIETKIGIANNYFNSLQIGSVSKDYVIENIYGHSLEALNKLCEKIQNVKDEALKYWKGWEEDPFNVKRSTNIMITANILEGITGIVEELGDGIATVVGWMPISFLFGGPDNIAKFIEKEWSHDFFENIRKNTGAYDYSSITADSFLGQVGKFAGKVIGYATVTGLAGKGLKALNVGASATTSAAQAARNANNIATLATAYGTGQGLGTERALQAGDNFNTASWKGAGQGAKQLAVAATIMGLTGQFSKDPVDKAYKEWMDAVDDVNNAPKGADLEELKEIAYQKADNYVNTLKETGALERANDELVEAMKNADPKNTDNLFKEWMDSREKLDNYNKEHPPVEGQSDFTRTLKENETQIKASAYAKAREQELLNTTDIGREVSAENIQKDLNASLDEWKKWSDMYDEAVKNGNEAEINNTEIMVRNKANEYMRQLEASGNLEKANTELSFKQWQEAYGDLNNYLKEHPPIEGQSDFTRTLKENEVIYKAAAYRNASKASILNTDVGKEITLSNEITPVTSATQSAATNTIASSTGGSIVKNIITNTAVAAEPKVEGAIKAFTNPSNAQAKINNSGINNYTGNNNSNNNIKVTADSKIKEDAYTLPVSTGANAVNDPIKEKIKPIVEQPSVETGNPNGGDPKGGETGTPQGGTQQNRYNSTGTYQSYNSYTPSGTNYTGSSTSSSSTSTTPIAETTPNPSTGTSTTPTVEPTPSPTPSYEPTPSPSPTIEPTPTPVPSYEPTPSPSPTIEPSPIPGNNGTPTYETAPSGHTGGSYTGKSGYSYYTPSGTTTAATEGIKDTTGKTKTSIDDIIKGNKYSKIPTITTPITAKQTSGSASVIPIASGLSAAAAAGIGAKAYMDHKKNNNNEDDVYEEEYKDDFSAEEWKGDNDTIEIEEAEEPKEELLNEDDEFGYDAPSEEYNARKNESLAEFE